VQGQSHNPSGDSQEKSNLAKQLTQQKKWLIRWAIEKISSVFTTFATRKIYTGWSELLTCSKWLLLWRLLWKSSIASSLGEIHASLSASFISKSFSITRKPAFAHFGKHEKKPFDIIRCLYKMKQSHWCLCITRNCDWSKKSHHCQTWFKWLLVEWTVKSTNVKENTGKINSVFVIRAALWAKELECFLEYCWSWKNTLGKHVVAVNTGRHLISVLNERRVTDSGNLCPLWLVILKLVWHGIGDT